MSACCLTDGEYDLIVHCLSMAALQFKTDADTVRGTQPRLAAQFDEQEKQAKSLYMKIDNRGM